MTTVVGPVKAAAGLAGGVSAAYNLAAAAVLVTGPAIVCTLICQSAGSVTLNDCASVAAAAITNQLYTRSMVAGQVASLSVPCGTGVTASVVSGVFSLTFS